MKDESETGYDTPSFPPGETIFKRLTGAGRLKAHTETVFPGALRSEISSASLNKDKTSKEDHMKEINEKASLSANQCKILGHLAVFSERVRRGVALKRRFRPGDGAHPLFFTI